MTPPPEYNLGSTKQLKPTRTGRRRRLGRSLLHSRGVAEPLEPRELLTATPQLIDFNQNANDAVTVPVVVGSTAYFVADDDLHGQELWKTDGSTAGTTMVADLVPGRDGSRVSQLVNYRDKLYFMAQTSAGHGLWTSDGTAQGTSLVKVLNADPVNPDGSAVEFPQNLVVTDDRLYFFANDGTVGLEPWISDGTTAGTRLIHDVQPGSVGSLRSVFSSFLFTTFVTLGERTYFLADDGEHGHEWWSTDGTSAGTRLLADINSTPNTDAAVSNPTLFAGRLFFVAADSTRGRELWSTDGTADGTQLFQDFNTVNQTATSVDGLRVSGDRLFVSANDGLIGSELWSITTSLGPATLVADINPNNGTTPQSPKPAGVLGQSLANVDGTLYFAGNNNVDGLELWRSDGTGAGTQMIANINPTPRGNSSPVGFRKIGNTIFFNANDGTRGVELWQTDGTAAGTKIVKDFAPGALSSGAQVVTADLPGGTLLRFYRRDIGRQLWWSSGDLADAQLVKDIGQRNDGGAFGDRAFFQDELYVAADTGLNVVDFELWRSDGTPAGTQMVKNINPAETGTSQGAGVNNLTVVGDRLLFTAGVPAGAVLVFRLWSTDGTEAGTQQVGQVSVEAIFSGTLLHQGQMYFAGGDAEHGVELWKTDGTAAGTQLVVDLVEGTAGSAASPLVSWGNAVYFAAQTPDAGIELWKTDGTASGTLLLKDIGPPEGYGGIEITPYPSVATTPNQLFFAANDGVRGAELWRTDGTPEGTLLVKDIRPGPYGGIASSAAPMISVGNLIYFMADDGEHGAELWRSDGTEAGTFLVKDIRSGAYGSTSLQVLSPDQPFFVEHKGFLYFVADDGVHGPEIWRTDGTADGTQLFRDMVPGDVGGVFDIVLGVSIGDQLFFRGTDAVAGSELWQTDGTEAGTRRVADLMPGVDSGSPHSFFVGGGDLYFVGRGPRLGVTFAGEYFVLRQPEVVSETYALNGVSRISTSDALGNLSATKNDNGVLANDIEPSGGTLTVRVVRQPQHGTVELQADGNFTYTAQAGFQGTDSFQYEVSNGSLVALGTATLKVRGVTGDIDSDGDVDTNDMLLFVSKYTGALENPSLGGRSFAEGDLDEDGDMDSSDLLEMIASWTGAAAQAQARFDAVFLTDSASEWDLE